MGIKFGYLTKFEQAHQQAEFIKKLKGSAKNECNENKGSGKPDANTTQKTD